MKRTFTLFAAILLLAVGAAAQKLSYQAVVRNSANELVYDATVSVSLKILAADGVTVQYAETQTTTTNQNGLLTLIIGEHPTGSYSLTNVNWTDASIRTDITLPTGDVVTNTMPVTAVPYALYADGAGGNLDQVQSDWTETNTASKAYIQNKPNIPTVPTNVSAFQNDAGYLTGYTETDPQFNAWDKDYNDLTNKPTIPTVPTNVSAFQNDAGYLTGYTETDPQFNAWNKDYNDLTNKPNIPVVNNATLTLKQGNATLGTFTANASVNQEIEIPTQAIPDQVNADWNATDGPAKILNKPTIPTVPTSVSAFQNDAGYLTSYTETDPQFNAWDKDYNDLTNKPTIPTVPTNVSAFQNDAGYLTSYTETQSLADVTAKGNSAGNRQLKNVSDPTDAQDAVTKSYLVAQTETITASIQQQLANLADQYQQQLGALTSSFQHQLDSLGGVIEAQQHLLDSLINGGSTPIPPTPAAPTATTSPATNLAATSATLNGTVSNPDNVTITAQGFEWKTTEGGTYAQVNAAGETMTYSLTGLAANTSYTYRAFVTTASGTSYGEEVTFTTLSAGSTAVIDEKSCPEAQTVTDHEGNVYATVQIGNQCWMRDNLRTTTSPSTGTYLIPAANANYTYTGKQARWFNNDSATYAPMNYGLLYNWNAAVDTFNTTYGETSVNTSSSNAVSVTFNGHRRGICPAGWHLPSDAEWTAMTNYVSSQSAYTCGGNNIYIAKALASETGWNSSTDNCAVGNTLTANNATGFSAVPAGGCVGSSFNGAGGYAGFWSSTQLLSSGYASYRDLDYGNARVYGTSIGKNDGSSVRCLRDESGNTVQAPTATTSSVTNITENSATLSGSVTNPDNVTIASKGFEYKALGSTAYTQVAATGTDDSFSATVSNLAPSTEYSYRAFVTYDNNTVYGGEVTFTTLCGNVQLSIQATKTSICPGVESVTLTASGAETYTWSTNETGASITITAPGYYTVVGQDANGCERFTDIYIYEEVCAPVPQVATLEPTHDPELYYHYLSGQIVSDNGSAVTECGFCISDGDQEPTYPNSAMSVQNWTGNTFNKDLHVSDFTEGVTYYVRAYARNSAGTGYGETVTIKWPKHPIVNLSDNDITNVTDNSAAATASVELRNCTGIVAAGFCWREIENNVYPTLEDSHTVEAGSTSDYSFSSAITGLTQGIEYIVRAYVTTDENLTVYSGSSYFTTKCGAPTFELSACGDDCVEVTYDLTNTGAMDGIGAYIQYKEAAASVNSWYEEYAFSSPYYISYFLPNTEYEIRVGSHCDDESVSWSESKYFTVPYGSSAPTPAVTSAIPCTITSGHPAQTAALGYTANGANHGLETVTSDGKINSVTDYDGNEYPVVQIGSQCWLAQNLRTTRYSDGTAITPGGSSTSATTAYYYDYSSSNIPLADRGYLYNWPAVMRNSSSSSVTPSGVQGICPSGWHVPSDAEWTQLTDYVSGQSEYVCGGNTSYIAKALASKTYWNTSSGTCYVGDTQSANNATGFGALPAGKYYNGCSNFGDYTDFWSATEASSGGAWYRNLCCGYAYVYRNSLSWVYGCSVRCLRD